jgi:hypothetical protein
MGIISLDAIKPGMVLAGDVKDRSGRILLSAGAEINEKHLRIFKMWGVLSAPVQGEEKEETHSNTASEIDPDLLREVERKTVELFCHNDLAHPFIRELFRLVTLENLRRPEDQNRGS